MAIAFKPAMRSASTPTCLILGLICSCAAPENENASGDGVQKQTCTTYMETDDRAEARRVWDWLLSGGAPPAEPGTGKGAMGQCRDRVKVDLDDHQLQQVLQRPRVFANSGALREIELGADTIFYDRYHEEPEARDAMRSYAVTTTLFPGDPVLHVMIIWLCWPGAAGAEWFPDAAAVVQNSYASSQLTHQPYIGLNDSDVRQMQPFMFGGRDAVPYCFSGNLSHHRERLSDRLTVREADFHTEDGYEIFWGCQEQLDRARGSFTISATPEP